MTMFKRCYFSIFTCGGRLLPESLESLPRPSPVGESRVNLERSHPFVVVNDRKCKEAISFEEIGRGLDKETSYDKTGDRLDETSDAQTESQRIYKSKRVRRKRRANESPIRRKRLSDQQLAASNRKVIQECDEVREMSSSLMDLRNAAMIDPVEKSRLVKLLSKQLREEKHKQLDEKLTSVNLLEETIKRQDVVIDKVKHLLQLYLEKAEEAPLIAPTRIVSGFFKKKEVSSTDIKLKELKMREEELKGENRKLRVRLQKAERRAWSFEKKMSADSSSWAKEIQELTSRVNRMRAQAGDERGLPEGSRL